MVQAAGPLVGVKRMSEDAGPESLDDEVVVLGRPSKQQLLGPGLAQASYYY